MKRFFSIIATLVSLFFLGLFVWNVVGSIDWPSWLISPPTPEESCQSASENIVKKSKADDGWPINITETSPLQTDPVLCKGTANFQDGGIGYIRFWEESDNIGFETLTSETCQDLANQLTLNASVDPKWPMKLEDLELIQGDLDSRLVCKALATFLGGRMYAVEISEDQGTKMAFVPLPISERECDRVLMQDIIDLSKELASRKPSQRIILKIYDPEEISNTNDKLTCGGQAMLDTSEKVMIEFHVEEDKDGDRFIGFDAE